MAHVLGTLDTQAKIPSEDLTRKDRFGHPAVDGKIILKQILKKRVERSGLDPFGSR
jgi:hypothetical protein